MFQRVGIIALAWTLLTATAFAQKLVVITAAKPPAAGDQMVLDRLKGMGLTVENYSQADAQPAPTAGAVGVIILESVSSANILGAYTKTALPVLNFETWTFDDMGWAVGDASFFSAASDTVSIEDASHPLAGGLKGEVKVSKALVEMMAISELPGDWKVVALNALSGNIAIATIDKGKKVQDGSSVPERRTIFFAHSNMLPQLTDDGWTLLEAAVNYTFDLIPQAIDPAGSLPTAWGEIKRRER